MSRDSHEVLAIVERIKPLLAGKAPEIQGAVLAELLALWLASHHPEKLRGELFAEHIKTVHALTLINVAILRDEQSTIKNRARQKKE